MRCSSLIIFLVFVSVCSSVIQAQSRISAGIGLGGNSYAEDRDFSVNKRTISLPDIIKDINYSAVEIPVIAYQNADRTLHLRFGLNGISATHDEKPVSWLSPNRKEVTSYEITTLNLFAAYIVSKDFFDTVNGFLLGGPTITETVLTEAREEFKVVSDNSGGTEDNFVGIQKEYRVDYGIGLVVGAGMAYTFGFSSEVGWQLYHFSRKTGLNMPNGSRIRSGSSQLQLFYLFRFE